MLGDNLGALGMAQMNQISQQQGLYYGQALAASMAQMNAMQINPNPRLWHAEPSTIDKMQSDVSLWLKDWDK